MLAVQRAGAALYDSIMGQYRFDGAKKAAHIQPKAQVLRIVAIQAGLFLNLQFIPAVDLCPASQTRPQIVGSVLIPGIQQVVLVPQRRTGADDRHIPHKDIPQLRQLIQAGAVIY